MGRTVDELINGSPTFKPLLAAELIEWIAYDEIIYDEQQKQRQ